MKILHLSFFCLLSLLLVSSCTRGKNKCWDGANAKITGYDQTKSLCGTGYIIKIDAQPTIPEKEYIVRELTGDFASQIRFDSKFPIKIYVRDKIQPENQCEKVITKLEVFKPTPFCPE